MQRLRCPYQGVRDLTFSPDGDMLAGVAGKTLSCWTRSRNWEHTGIRQRSRFTGLAFHPGARTLAYAAGPHSQPDVSEATSPTLGVTLRSLASVSEFDRKELLVGGASPGIVQTAQCKGLAFTPDGQTLLTTLYERGDSGPRSVLLHWHFMPSGEQWRVLNVTARRTVPVRGAAMVGTKCVVFIKKYGLELCALDPAEKALAYTPDLSSLQFVACSPAGERVAGVDDQQLHVWHLRQARPIISWPIRSAAVGALAFSPDGRTLATGEDGTITFRDPISGGRLSTFDYGVGPVRSLAYAPDGLTLAVAGERGLVVVDVA